MALTSGPWTVIHCIHVLDTIGLRACGRMHADPAQSGADPTAERLLCRFMAVWDNAGTLQPL